jgi:hypothetical protein
MNPVPRYENATDPVFAPAAENPEAGNGPLNACARCGPRAVEVVRGLFRSVPIDHEFAIGLVAVMGLMLVTLVALRWVA